MLEPATYFSLNFVREILPRFRRRAPFGAASGMAEGGCDGDACQGGGCFEFEEEDVPGGSRREVREGEVGLDRLTEDA